MRFARFNLVTVRSGNGVVVCKDAEQAFPLAGEIAEHMQSIAETIDGDAVSRVHGLDELNEMGFSVRERQILHPQWTRFISRMTVARKRIEIVEQNDRHASRLATCVLRLIGERVWRHRLRKKGLSRRSLRRSRCGFRGEDTDLLWFPPIQHDEIVFRQICHRAMTVPHDNANLHEMRRNVNLRSQRRVLRYQIDRR